MHIHRVVSSAKAGASWRPGDVGGWPVWLACVLAAASTAAAIALYWALAAGLDAQPAAPIVLLIPVILSAYLGGLGPGLVATAVGALGADWFLVPPPGTFAIVRPVDQVRLAAFVVEGVLFSVLSEALRRSRRRAESSRRLQEVTFASIGDAVIVCDASGRVTFLNPEAERLTGWSADEAAGQPLEAMYRVLDAGPGTRQPPGNGAAAVLLSRDGRETSVEERSSPIREADGVVRGTVRVFRDSTDRERAEAALRDSEERFRAVVEQASDAFFVHDSEGRFLDVNRRACESLGYTREELLRMGVGDIETEAPLGRVQQSWAQLEAGQAITLYGSQRRKDGSTFPVEIRLSVYLERGGRLYLGLVRDITGRKQAEAALHDSEERFRLFMNNSPAVAFLKDDQGRYAYVNQTYEQQFGVGPEDWRGNTDADLWLAPIAEQFRANDQKALGGRAIEVIEKTQGRGGDIRHWLTIKFPLSDSAGRRYVGGMAVDITERQRAQQELVELNASLERRVAERTSELLAANQELEAFSYSVSHDLRAPLRAVDGFTRLLAESYGDRLDDKGRDYLDRVLAATARMTQLIDDLLELSRITQAELTRQPVDLSAVAAGVAADLVQREPGRRVEFVIAPGITVNGDPRLLRLTLENLLGNAFKFSSGKEQARIELGSMRDEGGQPVWFVRDNGAGFDMRLADRLFGAFERLHSTREFPGTGIGLATVKRVIHRHGGQVWAEGKVGEGATVYFRIPE